MQHRPGHNLTGALFRRTAPTPNEGLPSYRGEIVINGLRYRLEGFLKRSKGGEL
jgi:hypothetical protein